MPYKKEPPRLNLFPTCKCLILYACPATASRGAALFRGLLLDRGIIPAFRSHCVSPSPAQSRFLEAVLYMRVISVFQNNTPDAVYFLHQGGFCHDPILLALFPPGSGFICDIFGHPGCWAASMREGSFPFLGSKPMSVTSCLSGSKYRFWLNPSRMAWWPSQSWEILA